MGKKHRIVRWIGWGVIYILAFYLGNVSGEFVAARMPIGAWSLPHMSLPKVQVQWIKPTFTSKNTPAPEAHTKPVVVSGKVFSMPLEGASQEEKQAFEEAIQKLAKTISGISIQNGCELNPAFVMAKKGSSMTMSNRGTSARTIGFISESGTVVAPAQTSAMAYPTEGGIHPIYCDGTIAGFFLLEE